MAIKIINRKRTYPIYQGECTHCGCTFEFEHSDANGFHDNQTEGFSYNVTCPRCNKRIWVRNKISRYE